MRSAKALVWSLLFVGASAQSQYRPGGSSSGGFGASSGGFGGSSGGFSDLRVVPLTSELEVVPVTWRRTFQESQEMITPSLLRCPTPPSFVTVRLREDTIQIPRPSAKSSTSVAVMAMVVLPSTASSVPTEPCSTSNTLSVTGGSMLIAPWLNSSTLSMIK